MMKINPTTYGTAIGMTRSHTFHFWPLARLLVTQRRIGGSLRMISGRLIATDW